MTFNTQYISDIVREQIRLLIENDNSEGFGFGQRGNASDGKFRFLPGQNDTNTTTRIFDDNGKEAVNMVMLPKSHILSYNLYKITSMSISKALKHPERLNGKYDEASIKQFMLRTALYIKHLLKGKEIDYITCPQSSSKFSIDMINYLLRLYPNSYGFKFVPNLLVKNVRKVYVNTEVAREIGLTNQEIHVLQQRVDKWRSDEDLRDLRRKIKELEDEIEEVKANRGKGRPSKAFTNKVDMLKAYNNQVAGLRKNKRGRDSTIDREGNVKDFQIKSIGDRERRSIEGLFEINPEYNGIQQKLVGKNVLVFDDNLSSGATLDDICLLLQKVGVKSIIPVTLAVIPKTIYGAHEHLS